MPHFLPFNDFSGSFCLAPKLNAEVLCSVPEHRKAVLYCYSSQQKTDQLGNIYLGKSYMVLTESSMLMN